MNSAEIISKYRLEPNPHGGWYRQTYSAPESVNQRPIATIIYYLLTAEDVSCTPHRTSADCINYFHAGSAIEVLTIDPASAVLCVALGPERSLGHELQVIVPGNCWKGFRLVEGQYGLISEAVVPGYLPADDVMASPSEFQSRYPEQWPLLQRYFRNNR